MTSASNFIKVSNAIMTLSFYQVLAQDVKPQVNFWIRQIEANLETTKYFI